MPSYQIEKPDEFLTKVFHATFPAYTGRKFHISTSIPTQLDSYWDGGSRDSYSFYNLQTGETYAVHTNHPFFEKDQPRKLNELPPDVVLVEHSIFCGKDHGLTLYARAETITPMLPASTDELTADEKLVLKLTAGLKSSYGGVSNLREHTAITEHGMTGSRWATAKTSMIEQGYLNKAGAITANGRNIVTRDRGW